MKKNILIVGIAFVSLIVYFWGQKEENSDIEKLKNSDKVAGISNPKKTKKEIVKTTPIDNRIDELTNKILDKKISFLERTKYILKLRNKRLSFSDERALMDHIKKVHLDEPHTITNDIIEHLVRFGSNKKAVGSTLLNILNNSLQDRVVREYALQYVPEFYQKRWETGETWNDTEELDRQKFNKALWELTTLSEGSMAGGALFALYKLSGKYSDIESNDVFDKSHEIVGDISYMTPNRMAAVQILAFSKNEEFFDTAKNIVLDKNSPVLLRVTAMHTASQSKFVDDEFVNYLNKISTGEVNSNPTIKKCANLTLKKLRRY